MSIQPSAEETALYGDLHERCEASNQGARLALYVATRLLPRAVSALCDRMTSGDHERVRILVARCKESRTPGAATFYSLQVDLEATAQRLASRDDDFQELAYGVADAARQCAAALELATATEALLAASRIGRLCGCRTSTLEEFGRLLSGEVAS